MARKRRVKIKEPGKLWEMPVEALQKELERLKPRFPTSRYVKVLEAEIAREDRSDPMDMDDWDL